MTCCFVSCMTWIGDILGGYRCGVSFTVPYAAIASAWNQTSNTASSILLVLGVMSPFEPLTGDQTSYGNLTTNYYDVSVYASTSTELELSGLSGLDRPSVSFTVADARSCTGVIFDSAAGDYNTTNAECDNNWINDAAGTAQPGMVTVYVGGTSTTTGMSAVQGALLNVSDLSAAQLAAEYRSQYRQCMIGAEFNATEVATCSDRLNSTMSWVDCTVLEWEDCKFRIATYLSQEKSTAGQEELDYREDLCDVGDCALATCGYSCTACTICRSQAEEYRDLVENIYACTVNCEDEEADADTA